METTSANTPPETDLWSIFNAADNDHDYHQGWLALQCQKLDSCIQGLLINIDSQGQPIPVAVWPQEGQNPAVLTDIVSNVLTEQCGLLAELSNSDHVAMAYPILIENQVKAIIAIELATAQEHDLQTAMEQLQWGSAWLELLLRRQQVERDQAHLVRLKTAVDLLATTLSKQQFDEAAIAFVTELAVACHCERVSIGFLRNHHIKLAAVSHSAEISPKMNLTTSIERVMEEALQQNREVAFPALNDDILICREHETLSRQQAMAAILSIPLYYQDHYIGVLTCEREAASPFTQEDLEFLNAIATLAGPSLDRQRQLEQSLPVTIWQAGRRQLENFFGPKHLTRKLIFFIFAALVLFLNQATGTYRLTADAILEGAIRRAIVVPFDGYINSADRQAGDLVTKGELLCSLDDRDLRLQKLAKVSQARQLERQRQEAAAKHDRSQSLIITAQLEQSAAELALLEARLSRTQLKAPFGGLIVSGDLSQRLGSAVNQGEVLFEITPLDSYRLIVKVDERRIADAQIGQTGTLVLAALPDDRYDFKLEKITPITTAADGRNYFRVEAKLEYIDDSLRPGMEGVAKITVDERKLISIWSRNFVEWLKLTLWNWSL